jgi:hypothetical protein
MTTVARFLQDKFFPGEMGWRGRNATIAEAKGDSLTLLLDQCPCPEHHHQAGQHTINSRQGFSFRLSREEEWELEVHKFNTTHLPSRNLNGICLTIDYGNPLTLIFGAPATGELEWFRNQKGAMHWVAELLTERPQPKEPVDPATEPVLVRESS